MSGDMNGDMSDNEQIPRGGDGASLEQWIEPRRVGCPYLKVTMSNPELGEYTFNIHGLSCPDCDHLTLVAFRGCAPNYQLDVMARTAEHLGWPLIELEPDSLTEEVLVEFVEDFAANPTKRMVVLEVEPVP